MVTEKTVQDDRPGAWPAVETGALDAIHQDLAYRLTAVLAGCFQERCWVRWLEPPPAPAAVAVPAFSEEVVAFRVQLNGQDTGVLLLLDGGLADWMVDRLLGGKGRIERPARALTALEIQVLGAVVEKIAREWVMEWEIALGMDGSALNVVAASPSVQQRALDDPHLRVGYAVVLADGTGRMELIVPAVLGESMLRAARRQMPAGRGARQAGPTEDKAVLRQHLMGHLAQVLVSLSARWPAGRLSLKEIAELETGDILLLPVYPQDLVSIYVGGQEKYRGRPGRLNQHLGIQIEALVEPAPVSMEEVPLVEASLPDEETQMRKTAPVGGDRRGKGNEEGTRADE